MIQAASQGIPLHYVIFGLIPIVLSIVKNMRSGSGVTQNGAELLQSGRGLTTKVGKQPWPQLVRCVSICCRMCGCVFQED